MFSESVILSCFFDTPIYTYYFMRVLSGNETVILLRLDYISDGSALLPVVDARGDERRY